MAALPAISMIAGLVGAGVQAAGTLAAGREAQRAAEFEANQLEQQAKQKQAEAQLESEQYRRQRDVALSSLQADAAGSGFSATDPTALALADEISRYGTYQQQLANFGGKQQRTGLEAQAYGRRQSGKAAMKGARYDAFGTLIGGVSSIAQKYGKSFGSSGSSYAYG